MSNRAARRHLQREENRTGKTIARSGVRLDPQTIKKLVALPDRELYDAVELEIDPNINLGALRGLDRLMRLADPLMARFERGHLLATQEAERLLDMAFMACATVESQLEFRTPQERAYLQGWQEGRARLAADHASHGALPTVRSCHSYVGTLVRTRGLDRYADAWRTLDAPEADTARLRGTFDVLYAVAAARSGMGKRRIELAATGDEVNQEWMTATMMFAPVMSLRLLRGETHLPVWQVSPGADELMVALAGVVRWARQQVIIVDGVAQPIDVKYHDERELGHRWLNVPDFAQLNWFVQRGRDAAAAADACRAQLVERREAQAAREREGAALAVGPLMEVLRLLADGPLAEARVPMRERGNLGRAVKAGHVQERGGAFTLTSRGMDTAMLLNVMPMRLGVAGD